MGITISDAYSPGKAKPVIARNSVSDSCIATLRGMSRRPRNEPLTHFIRDLISKHVEAFRARHGHEKGSLLEIARLGGFPNASTIAMAKKDTGVSWKTAPRFARAFGYRDAAELEKAAMQWWLQKGAETSRAVEQPPTEAMASGIEAVLLLKQGTIEQIKTIVAQISIPRFRDRDADWWRDMLLDELKRDRDLLEGHRRQTKAIRKEQKEIRETHAKAQGREKPAKLKVG